MKHYTEIASGLEKEFKERFGELNAQQLWTITKFAKLVRSRCRQNTAFNTAAKLAFPYANFKTVTKTNKKTGEPYPGLEITVAGQTASDSNGDDDE